MDSDQIINQIVEPKTDRSLPLVWDCGVRWVAALVRREIATVRVFPGGIVVVVQGKPEGIAARQRRIGIVQLRVLDAAGGW